jgi:2-keto-3-deoxy-L-rhamnonate aldolase RhmA
VITVTIKEKVTGALPMTGTHVNLTDPIVTEIFASVGYDFIWVDMELSDFLLRE